MTQSSEDFARLLTEGIYRIRKLEGKPIRVIQDELGYLLGREGGSAVEHWRKGRLPPNLTDVEQLARALVQRGKLEREWLDAFLRSAGHPAPESLDAELVSKEQAAARRPQTRLPVSASPLVGRLQELSSLSTLLKEPACRLITLLGPGGIGKTSLALHLADDNAAAFADGVSYISLVETTDPASFVPAMAKGLGITVSASDDGIDQVLEYLRQKEMLIVLDNFDQVVPEASFLEDVLARAPRVTLLVTSREKLGLQREWAFDLGGLETPPRGSISTEQIRQYSAVTLFLQCARHASPTFAANAEEYVAIARICRIVQGMPLAIELAASWVRVLSCSHIAEELVRDLGFLSSNLSNMPARHWSLGSVFEQSWRLLTPEEQKLLARLSVFRGSFTRQAAEAVAEASMPLLAALIDKSLVRHIPPSSYELHQYVRQFATTKLAQLGELESTQKRHIAFVFRQAKDELRQLNAAGFHGHSDSRPNQSEPDREKYDAISRRSGLRVLMLSPEYEPNAGGGLVAHVSGLLTAFADAVPDHSLSIDLLTPQPVGGASWEELSPVVRIHRVDAPALMHSPAENHIASNRRLIEYAHRVAEHQSFQLIHIHDGSTGLAGISLAQDWNVPLLATLHSIQRNLDPDLRIVQRGDQRQIDNLEKAIGEKASRFIVCSRFMRQELHDRLDVPLRKIAVIPNGVELMEECPPGQLQRLRQKYAPSGERLLLYVGPIRYNKGLLVLLRALPLILASHPNTRLLIVGEHGDALRPLVYEMNIEHSVEFLGYVSNHVRTCLYQVVDATVIPSLYEPFGIVALEAMAVRCSVIASAVGGLGEVVRHMETGLNARPGDPESIAWAVNELLADPVTAQALRVRALQEIQTNYRWETIASRTAKVYSALLNQGSPSI
ncbi:MAG: glycosyltransferase [Caldilineaceae bacterium]